MTTDPLAPSRGCLVGIVLGTACWVAIFAAAAVIVAIVSRSCT